MVIENLGFLSYFNLVIWDFILFAVGTGNSKFRLMRDFSEWEAEPATMVKTSSRMQSSFGSYKTFVIKLEIRVLSMPDERICFKLNKIKKIE